MPFDGVFEFSVCKTMSHLSFFFPILMHFISSSCVIGAIETSNITSNKNGAYGILILDQILDEMVSAFPCSV